MLGVARLLTSRLNHTFALSTSRLSLLLGSSSSSRGLSSGGVRSKVEAVLNLEEVKKVLSDLRAEDIQIIPVKSQCEWTDFMVIATGTSTWHVRNIAQALIHKVKQKQKGAERLLLPSVQGHEGGNWVVIDSGNVIVHALDEKARSYYKLESLWLTEMAPKGPNQDLEKALNTSASPYTLGYRPLNISSQ
ncbi:hypothetical protein AMTR_s00020p00168290 [Amborella trichopoda]|uniref:Ribosome silencing factor n=1 Tax=Amborella trichopoda TaxID=13333 RepID=W1PUX9_AMBTC|nr:hypothetical protein AMTR_s00020p00168290 [Amborella trichopoda]